MAGNGEGPDFEEIADELYGLTPSEFTAARDARAAEARKAGRRDVAEAIKRLRRPTAGAGLANLLAHRAPDDLDRLLDLGAALRQAQSELAGEALRRLSRQRQQVISGLVAKAMGLAEEAGQSAGSAAARELQETLDAALSDPEAAEAVRGGRLAVALSYSGLGEPGAVARAVATPKRQAPAPTRPANPAEPANPSPPANETRAAEQAEEAEKAARAERARQAQEALADARSAFAAATTARDEGQQAADDAARRLEERRQELVGIEERYRAAQEAVDEAEHRAAATQTELAAQSAALDRAREHLAQAETEAETDADADADADADPET